MQIVYSMELPAPRNSLSYRVSLLVVSGMVGSAARYSFDSIGTLGAPMPSFLYPTISRWMYCTGRPYFLHLFESHRKIFSPFMGHGNFAYFTIIVVIYMFHVRSGVDALNSSTCRNSHLAAAGRRCCCFNRKLPVTASVEK